jgi:hypothetical protein
MKRIYTLMALGLVAALALSGIAMAKDHGRDDRPGDDHGHHGRHDKRDDHGRHHGRHHRDRFIGQAGTVSSFDPATGKLTVALTSGESVTGLVTSATEIKCEGVDNRLQRRDHGGGDNGGRGEPEPGDDHGGQNEPGDDNGGATPLPEAEAGCSTGSLIPGEVVSEAELRLEGGAAFFEEVELGFHS